MGVTIISELRVYSVSYCWGSQLWVTASSTYRISFVIFLFYFTQTWYFVKKGNIFLNFLRNYLCRIPNTTFWKAINWSIKVVSRKKLRFPVVNVTENLYMPVSCKDMSHGIMKIERNTNVKSAKKSLPNGRSWELICHRLMQSLAKTLVNYVKKYLRDLMQKKIYVRIVQHMRPIEKYIPVQ